MSFRHAIRQIRRGRWHLAGRSELESWADYLERRLDMEDVVHARTLRHHLGCHGSGHPGGLVRGPFE